MASQEIPRPIATQPKQNNDSPNPPIQYYSSSSSSRTSSGTSTSSLLSVAEDVVYDCDPLLSNLNRQQEQENKTKRSRYDFDGNGGGLLNKKPKRSEGSGLGFVVPEGFLAPLPLRAIPPLSLPKPTRNHNQVPAAVGGNDKAQAAAAAVVIPVKRGCKQFWKAGDYEGSIVTADDSVHSAVGMDHVRVHPKFLHSNATSHKWALGAFAELLDNALDEVQHGASYVHVDVLENKKDHTRMLLVEDNGGGMAPDKMRACMSLGYSAKSKMANTIGQYGNGFKTSTMRLGADVIVFSRCQGKDEKSATQSIGLLSYTFLTATGKEDIVVPMIDFEKRGKDWNKKIRSSLNDWDMNLKTILQWSPYSSEEDLLQQFNFLKNQGARIIIYNLWDDDEGNMELCFDADSRDIQIRGVDRDRKNTIMTKRYPNSRHFLTYQHSLRSYASILYLRLPPSFRIRLRGEEVVHHNIVNDMMHAEDISYKPLQIPGVSKNTNMAATGKIGFVKDARHHIDVQGFNVYHKNRLIKPFWRVWNAAGSNGRGVIAVLEANFVEPAHDKQGFERTLTLSRLEQRLLVLQKNYWNKQCHLIGYAAKRQLKSPPSDTEQSACFEEKTSAQANQNKQCSAKGDKRTLDNAINQNRQDSTSRDSIMNYRLNSCKRSAINDASRGASHDASFVSGKSLYNSIKHSSTRQTASPSSAKQAGISKDGQVVPSSGNVKSVSNLKAENQESSLDVIGGTESHFLEKSLQYERDRCRKLQSQLQETISQLEAERKRAEQLEKDRQFLIDMIQDERTKQDEKEDRLMEKFKNASETIEDPRNRVRQLEGRGACKIENC